ncbi:hypothetical protein DQ384_07355 [Sphaerisporangium album]|uniref:DUF6879 domain-containing protein n=1 Tax=Sphaerisporangium album TaxID=509200 RepID=A0A367FPG4_9ACTN|nr:DUF6879 family protein [Sphaerisporangium album]RCG32306.1 hypothetical protein DQ384_07355 [Sphaerisporangium album]
MRDILESHSGERLTLEAYLADFNEHFWAIREHDFWKLERRQTFQEPGDESWEAFSAGDSRKALQLLEDRRGDLQDYYHRITGAGFRTWRVRVIEEPITPYLRWELHLLRLRHAYGGSVRVIGPGVVQEMESGNQLPELVTLGATVMYEVLYDEHGIITGGVRYADHGLITKCREIIRELYAAGEDLEDFFVRNHADLDLSND